MRSGLRNCTVSRGVFLTKVGGDEAEIEEMFREAIRTAKEQKSTCLTKRAEATYKNSAAERESVRGTRAPTAFYKSLAAPCLFLKHLPEKSFLNAGFRSAAQVPRSQEFCY
jgi:hypothetical protein